MRLEKQTIASLMNVFVLKVLIVCFFFANIQFSFPNLFLFISLFCSAIQTGRNPIHVNVQNVLPEVVNHKDKIGGYQGIPTNMTCIASVLRRGKFKYRTHIVGKWDVGMATEMHHPRARGYESWLGKNQTIEQK